MTSDARYLCRSWASCMTSGQEPERVYSYNAGPRHGAMYSMAAWYRSSMANLRLVASPVISGDSLLVVLWSQFLDRRPAGTYWTAADWSAVGLAPTKSDLDVSVPFRAGTGSTALGKFGLRTVLSLMVMWCIWKVVHESSSITRRGQYCIYLL